MNKMETIKFWEEYYKPYSRKTLENSLKSIKESKNLAETQEQAIENILAIRAKND